MPLSLEKPHDDRRGSELGAPYAYFAKIYVSFKRLRRQLAQNVAKICAAVDVTSAEELFCPHQKARVATQ